MYSASPVVSRHGSGVLAVAIDTTAQVEAARRAEEQSEERRRTLQRYEALMSAVPQIIWLMKPDWSITELVGGFDRFAAAVAPGISLPGAEAGAVVEIDAGHHPFLSRPAAVRDVVLGL